jgi:tetraacyldisaccharide 4'-kinase
MMCLRDFWLMRLVLYPFAVLYGGVTDLRNFLYDRRILKITAFTRPVISIGNITAGGSGKTPFTMLLTGLLSAEKKVAVVSRGYGRRSRGLQIVSDGRGKILPVLQSGDEPALIARRYPQTPVLVAENRAAGINEAIRLFDPDLILLDDAFQHRQAARDCDIVLLSAATPLGTEKMLPSGNLREKLKNLKRANLVVITGSGESQNPGDQLCLKRFFNGPLYQCQFKPAALVDAGLNQAGELSDLRGKRCAGLTAIAHPQQFRQMLLREGLLIGHFQIFADHHFFSETDQKRLISLAKEKKIENIVTTEKDIVKLDAALFKGLNLVAVRRSGELHDLPAFLNNLRTLIDLKN